MENIISTADETLQAEFAEFLKNRAQSSGGKNPDFRNGYQVSFRVTQRIPGSSFSATEEEIIDRAKERFNEYFRSATPKQTKNPKWISEIILQRDVMVIKFTTQYPLTNLLRRGNAMRQLSRFLSEEGFDLYLHEQRLCRAA